MKIPFVLNPDPFLSLRAALFSAPRSGRVGAETPAKKDSVSYALRGEIRRIKPLTRLKYPLVRAGYPVVVEDCFRRALHMRRIGQRLAMRVWAKRGVWILQESRQGVTYTFTSELLNASGWSKLLGEQRIAARLVEGGRQ